MTVTKRWSRAVLHVDMDAFFASVEVLDDPRLAGRSVLVAGDGPRSVVAAASYEARRFGVRSAQPTAVALRRCPDAVVVAPRHARYEQVSSEVMAILATVSPIVEPLSLDEAFVDVGGSQRLFGTPRRIAEMLRERIADELRLSCGVGVAAVKSIAKMGSAAAKPVADRSGIKEGPGIVCVPPGAELEFLSPRPVGELWGVGPRTAELLADRSIETIGDLRAVGRPGLERLLGRAAGRRLFDLANGHDPRRVDTDRSVSSISHEVTFGSDVDDPDTVERHLVDLSHRVARRARVSGRRGRVVTIKVRSPDFTTRTRSRTLGSATDDGATIGAIASTLVAGLVGPTGVRLVGVALTGFDVATAMELPFGGADAPQLRGPADRCAIRTSRAEINRLVDSVADRFGDDAIGRAAALRRAPGPPPPPPPP